MTGLVDNALMVFEDSILISLQTMSAMWVAFWLLFHMALLKPQSVLKFSLFFKVNLQVIYCNVWFPKLPTKCTYLWCLWLIYSPLSFPISSPPKFSSCEEADPVKKKRKMFTSNYSGMQNWPTAWCHPLQCGIQHVGGAEESERQHHRPISPLHWLCNSDHDSFTKIDLYSSLDYWWKRATLLKIRPDWQDGFSVL